MHAWGATGRSAIGIAWLLLSAPPASAAEDPCAAAQTAADVKFALAVKDGRTEFREGEIIALELSFTSTAKKRYWADERNYDRSGRLGIECYCIEPEAPDPLATYFKTGGFMGGGLGGTHELDATAFTAGAELNEWRAPGPGHYRLYAISHRVWRAPDPKEQTPYGRVGVVVRSNTVEFDVRPADEKWQEEALRDAVGKLASGSPEEARRAGRRLRFLNTAGSTRELARLFWGLNQQQPGGWDLMFGLYGSSHRKVATDAMREQLAAPDHAITGEYLNALVNLQVSAESAWDPETVRGAGDDAVKDFWERRQAHTRALMRTEMEKVIAALPRKEGKARAMTLHGLLAAGGSDEAIAKAIRPALIAAWSDLPAETQRDLVQYRWATIASPEMLPILRRMVAEAPPPGRTDAAMARDAALQHIAELDAAAGRELILRDALDARATPGLVTIGRLPKEDIAAVVGAAVERIGRGAARDLDYELLDRYADAGALGVVRPVFEELLGKWACAPQSAMLRYFLRVDAAYGAQQVKASLGARSDTRCFANLFQSLDDALPKAQQSAVESLDDADAELVQDAVLALGRWGSPDAESALWGRLGRFHEEWAGREGELRMTPDYTSPGARGATLEQGLVQAIATGRNWICPPEKLARIGELVWTKGEREQVQGWIKQWKAGPALISPSWTGEGRGMFSVLQYVSLTEDQLLAKMAQFPQGTRLLWQFWRPGQIAPPVSMAVQDALYERMREAAAKNGVTLEKVNHP